MFLTGDHGACGRPGAPARPPLPAGSVATNADRLRQHDRGAAAGGAARRRDARSASRSAPGSPTRDTAEGARPRARTSPTSRSARTSPRATGGTSSRRSRSTAGHDRPVLHDRRPRPHGAGANERYVPGPGYHDRDLQLVARDLRARAASNGILQHYGVYLPTGYSAGRADADAVLVPLPRRQRAHRGGVVPGRLQGHGRGRSTRSSSRPTAAARRAGTSASSQVDFLQVWADSHKLLHRPRPHVHRRPLDGRLGVVAAADPATPTASPRASRRPGPPTQGAVARGCDDDAVLPSRPTAATPARRVHLPAARQPALGPATSIYQGTEDELVPVTGVTMQAKRMQDLGYRYRYYLFPRPGALRAADLRPVEGGRELRAPVRPRPQPAGGHLHPQHAFEHAIEHVNSDKWRRASCFDHAYWMSGLEPVDAAKGVARFDGRSLAIPDPPHTHDAGGRRPGDGRPERPVRDGRSGVEHRSGRRRRRPATRSPRR